MIVPRYTSFFEFYAHPSSFYQLWEINCFLLPLVWLLKILHSQSWYFFFLFMQILMASVVELLFRVFLVFYNDNGASFS